MDTTLVVHPTGHLGPEGISCTHTANSFCSFVQHILFHQLSLSLILSFISCDACWFVRAF